MKTIPTIAMTFALALSLSACATPSKPIQLNLASATSVAMDEDTSKPESVRKEVFSILGQIVVACASSGYCW